MKQTYWDEIAETDSKELNKIALPGWLVGSISEGGCMMVQVSQIVRVIGENGLEGRAKILLSNEDLLFTEMSFAEVAEEIRSFQSPHTHSAIYKVTEIIGRIITFGGIIRDFFFRIIAMRVVRSLSTRCLALFGKRNNSRNLEKTHLSERSPLEGESVR